MQRFLNTILFFCFILCFLTIYPQNASSEIIDNVRDIEPAVYYKSGKIDPYKTLFNISCVEVYTGKKIACSHVVKILSPTNENCSGGVGIRCGHNDASHTVSRATILSNNDSDTFQILGWLSDASNTKATHLQSSSVDYYSYNFFSGEISSMLGIEDISYGLPPGWGFLPPCESRATCTIIHPIKTKHLMDFDELQKPQTPDDGYVRCGRSLDCKAKSLPDSLPNGTDPTKWLEYDDPYNWPAHPTTGWGNPRLLQELSSLAQTWYTIFEKPMVINDISLPYGGLLDVKIDWKRPHASHRKGISADILSVGVPNDIKPTRGPTDRKWVSVWEDYNLLDDINLRYLKCSYRDSNGKCVPDYNHLDLIQ